MIRTQDYPPVFKRSDVAILLRCSNLTIANREKKGKYPEPRRDHNGHRLYSMQEVFELMIITHGKIVLKPIVGILYEKGYTDTQDIEKFLSIEFHKHSEKNAQAERAN